MALSPKIQSILDKLKGGLIVSCQAAESDGIYGPDRMADMAKAAELGGAVGIRADGPETIRKIRQITKLPIIGIYKEDVPGYEPRITLNMDRAKELYDAGSDIIAFDATDRPHPYNITSYELISKAVATFDCVIMADCSTLDDAIKADKAGAHILSSTMSGYTSYSIKNKFPDFILIKNLKKSFPNKFIIAEGRINTPEYGRRLIMNGADSICVGSNITKPKYITERYINKLLKYPSINNNKKTNNSDSNNYNYVLSFDIGGTKINCSVVNNEGHIYEVISCNTPNTCGDDIYNELIKIGDIIYNKWINNNKNINNIDCISVSSGGTINYNGDIIYATDTLIGWKDYPLRDKLNKHYKLPTFIINDGNAAALGEAIYGKYNYCQSILGITIGTGFGAGLIIDGNIYYGTLDYAINMGGLIIQRDGKISDKVEGALEAYVSGRCIYEQYKLLEPYSNINNGKEVGDLAIKGNINAINAINKVAEWLGIGIACIVACHNPEIVVLGGGVIELGDLFINKVRESFKIHAFPALKNTQIEIATFGAYANLVGAAAYALDNM